MIRIILLPLIISALQAQPVFQTVDNLPNGYALPFGILVQGPDQNLYGAAFGNDTLSNSDLPLIGGIIYKATQSGALSTLHTFIVNGDAPTSLIVGSDGNLYGTSAGDMPCSSSNLATTCGSVFRLTPAGSYTALHQFSGPDGYGPANLIQGTDGNLYGITGAGGGGGSCVTGTLVSGCGTIFKITTTGSFSTLYQFSGSDGCSPYRLIQGSDGNFYGVSGVAASGYTNCALGTPSAAIFKFTPNGSLTRLYDFPGDPTIASLIQGKDGNLYGVNDGGGPQNCATSVASKSVPSGCGTIFQLTPQGALATLYGFAPLAGDSPSVPGSLIQASDGNFYGTTGAGGSGNCSSGCGTIFQLKPEGSLTTLYSFPPANVFGMPNDPAEPAALIQATNGNLYGVTGAGGTANEGTIFELSLTPPNTPVIASNGVVNSASYQPGVAAGSWFTIQGTNLSSITDSWSNSIVNGALPTKLDGVSVMVGDEPAYIAYVSPTQINAVAPNAPAGTVAVTVTTSIGASQPLNVLVSAEQPAFFQWGSYAVATHQDFTYAVKNGAIAGLTTVPAQPGDVIILWGTGFGPTSPAAPAGMETPSTTAYNSATPVTVTIGKQPATVYGAALAPGLAGLYQIAIQIPASLATGDYPVVATVDGVSSPSTTLITIQQ